MIDTKKTTQDILQEEMLREKVAVLARTGEQLAKALDKLHVLECEIEAAMAVGRLTESGKAGPAGSGTGVAVAGKTGAGEGGRQPFPGELNDKIISYNRQRDHVLTCYYYLIVTREALGMIHHQRLEEIYRIPPKRRCLPEG